VLPGAARELARFVLVGVSNTLLSFSLYVALLSVAVPYVPAAVISFGAGALNGYVLNRRWTFAAPDSRVARLRYLVVQLGGVAATSTLLWVVVSEASLGRVAGYAVAVPLVTASMFLANRTWTFAERGSRPRLGYSTPRVRAIRERRTSCTVPSGGSTETRTSSSAAISRS
jgi:putative flippase GtrA